MPVDLVEKDIGVLAKILDAMPILVALIHPAGRVLYWSKELESLFGYTSDDISTVDDWWPLAYPDESYREKAIRAWYQQVQSVILNEKVEPLEWVVNCKDGLKKSIEISIAILSGFYLVLFKDNTQRKRAADELTRSEQMLRESQYVAQLGHYDWNVITNTWVSSEIMDNIFGIEADYDKTVEGWLTLVHPEDRSGMHDYIFSHVLANKNRFDKEYRIIRPSDGAVRWVHGLGEIDVNADGLITRMYGTIQDVTERKLTEEAFRFTQYVMDNMPDLAMWINPDARFIYVNKATMELLGYTREEMLGLTVADINPYFPIETWAAHWKELREKNGMTFESIQKSKDGQIHPVEITAKIVEFEGAEYNCAFIRDIAERKRTEMALKQREEEDIRRKQEAEATAKQFLRDTVYAVTDGRLNLIGYKDADQLCLENCYLVEVKDAETLGAVRARVADTALELGMPDDRVHALVSAVSEAAENALKHAGGGIVSIHDLDDRIRVGIRDRGEGIESLILPTATLMTRFSTKRSMGFGYAIMLSSVDAVYLATGPQGTSIILEKRIMPVSSEISLEQLPDVW